MTATEITGIEATSVLVVEDEGLIAMDLKRRLERFGYFVPAIAATAEDALSMASSCAPDLILMDVRLKGNGDGIAAAAQVREEFDIPVVFLTAHGDAETLRRASMAEPFGYIVKPFGSTDLRAHIEIALYKHRAERKLRASEAWLSATLRSVGDAVIAADPDGAVTFMNTEAEQLTGWSLDEARGMPLSIVFNATDRKTGTAFPRAFEIPEPGGSQGAGSYQARRGEYWLAPRPRSNVGSTVGSNVGLSVGASPSPVETVYTLNRNEGSLLGAVIAFRDIAGRLESERVVRQNRSMETVSVMAGALAHDFNNLLTIILGYAEVLQSDPRRKCDQVAEIQRAGQLAAGLSRQLLTVSRGDAMGTEVFDLNQTLRASAKMLKQVIGEPRELVLKTSPERLPICSDPARLQQVLINLAINARDAMQSGGRLTVDTSITAEGKVRLSIADTGTGMDAETLERIFEPYFSRKGSRGTGLGMTIVHSIVTHSGGTIDVESEPGKGTAFRILFPLAPEESPEAAFSAPESPHSARIWQSGLGTVLLVDDNNEVRRLFKQQLDLAGFQTIEAASGEDALLLLNLRGESVDLLITDVMMPRMTGSELARKCVTRSPGTRILFVSGNSEESLEGNGLLESGQAEFVAKPVTPSDLVAKVRSLLKRP